MSSEIKNQQHHAEGTHCRSHVINLPIVHGQFKHCLLFFTSSTKKQQFWVTHPFLLWETEAVGN